MDTQSSGNEETVHDLTRKPALFDGERSHQKAKTHRNSNDDFRTESHESATEDLIMMDDSASSCAQAPSKTNRDDASRSRKGRGGAKGAHGLPVNAASTRSGTAQKRELYIQQMATGRSSEENDPDWDNQALFQEINRLKQTLDVKERDLVTMRTQIAVLECQTGESEKRIASLTDGLTQMKETNITMYHERCRAWQIVRNLQDDGLKKLDQRDEMFIPDDELQRQFKEAKNDIDDWIATYTVQDIQSWKATKAEVIRSFGEVKPSWYTSRIGSAAITQGKLSPRVLLTAWVASLTFRNLFEGGFSWCSGMLPASKSSSQLYKFLEQIQETAQKGDPLKGPQWRSLTLEILQRFEQKNQPTCRVGYLDPKTQKNAHVQLLVNHIITTCGPLLRKLDEVGVGQQAKELTDILRMMCELSTRCMQQPVPIRLLSSRKDLADFKQLHFSAKSDLFVARSSEGLCDKDDLSKDGYDVDLVIEPAVIAMKKKQDSGEPSYTVWQKGLLWLGDRGERGAHTVETESQAEGYHKRKQADSANAGAQDRPKMIAKHDNEVSHNVTVIHNKEPLELTHEAAESSNAAKETPSSFLSNENQALSRARSTGKRGKKKRSPVELIELDADEGSGTSSIKGKPSDDDQEYVVMVKTEKR